MSDDTNDKLPSIPRVDSSRCPCGAVIVGSGTVTCDCGRTMWITPSDDRTRTHGQPNIPDIHDALRHMIAANRQQQRFFRPAVANQERRSELIASITCHLSGHEPTARKRRWPVWDPWQAVCQRCGEVLDG